ncbi:MAG: undecaprenyl/decaprenyl-phosphate alpha-N-acetylglucosaminyl 1-phosphate transferase [Flavobacteriales bacterium]|nr:undecaprenyl/decaprenyl-phosphate alpha-N-acetylglucosaminyl 1-phosphate transferase [Flavobacteriales bacterium]
MSFIKSYLPTIESIAALILVGIVIQFTLLKVFKNLGLRKTEKSNQLRWSQQAKPTVGGVGIMICLLLGAFIFTSIDQIPYMDPKVIPWFAFILAFLIGLIDDLFSVRALFKLLVQICCGFCLVWYFSEFQDLELTIYSKAFILFWTVLMMNSVNMLDNMDGVSGAVVLVGTATLVAFNNWPAQLICSLALVSIVPFLVFNLPKAKLYMGDSGSMVLGVFVAWVTLGIGFLFDGIGLNLLWLPIFLWPALTDTAIVTINRLLAKRSPFVGGRDHSTHHLSYLGWSNWGILLFFVINTGLFSWLGVKNFSSGTNLFKWISVLYMVTYAISLWLVTRRNVKQGKFSYQDR